MVISQSKKDKNNKKYITKRLTSNSKWVILVSSKKLQKGGMIYEKSKNTY